MFSTDTNITPGVFRAAQSFVLTALLIIIGVGCAPEKLPQDQRQELERAPSELPTHNAASSTKPQITATDTAKNLPPMTTTKNGTNPPVITIPPNTSVNVNPNIDTSDWEPYHDELVGFEFKYPPAFGMPSNGTGRDLPGTRDRGYAVRFLEFSSGIREGIIYLEGEVVVTSGRPWVAAQALGSLHDSLTMGAFIGVLPEPLRDHLLDHIRDLNPANFCVELAQEQHLDPSHPALASLLPAQQDALLELDKLRNENPKVVHCDVSGDSVSFLKRATFRSGTVESRQYIYGAIRFVEEPFSSIQIIRITIDQPKEELLTTMASVVNSFQTLQ